MEERTALPQGTHLGNSVLRMSVKTAWHLWSAHPRAHGLSPQWASSRSNETKDAA